MDRNQFAAWLIRLYPDVTPDQLERFEQFRHLIEERNEEINLVSRAENIDLYEKHFADSLLFPSLDGAKGALWIDLGAGAGFPGFPLKIIRPDITLYMLEPTRKRAKFLSECVEKLNLTKTTIVAERAEIYANEAREMFDILVARAVAPLNILLELAAPLLKVGGFLYAFKGNHADKELIEASTAIAQLGLREAGHQQSSLPELGHIRHLLVFEKVAATPLVYPRAYASIKHQPL